MLRANASGVTACQAQQSRPDREVLTQLLRPALLKHFPAAFLGRLVVVPYYPLGDAEIRAIVRLKLAKVQRRFLANHQTELTYDEALIQAITDRCTEVDSGARNVDHILTHSLLPELAAQVLERMSLGEAFRSVHVALDATGGFTYAFSDEAPDAPTSPRPGPTRGVLHELARMVMGNT